MTLDRVCNGCGGGTPVLHRRTATDYENGLGTLDLTPEAAREYGVIAKAMPKEKVPGYRFDYEWHIDADGVERVRFGMFPDAKAVAAAAPPKAKPVKEKPAPKATANRAQLEEKAAEVGLAVQPQWSDAKLAAEIEAREEALTAPK